MTRYASDPEYARLERAADLIAKHAIYHGLRYMRTGPARPAQTGWAALMTQTETRSYRSDRR